VEEAVAILELIKGMKNPCFTANIEQKAKDGSRDNASEEGNISLIYNE